MIIILGAGPAGISAGYHLHKKGINDFIIIEKQNDVGGLCRSFELGGTIFDHGDHIFFTKHDYIRNLVFDECKNAGNPMFKQKRSAFVYSYDTFVPFPFQSNLYGLPVNVVKECIMGLINVDKTAKPPESFKDWCYQAFGKGIAEHFMIPYNEKIWAHPLDMIISNWTGERVIQPNYTEIIEGALQRREYNDHPTAYFAFPSKGGFDEIIKILSTNIKKNIINGDVDQINITDKYITLTNGDVINYDKLISTIPLNSLVYKTSNIDNLYIDAANKLKSFAIHIVSLVFKSVKTDKQHLYCADASVPWHRLGIHSNLSPYLKSLPTFGIQAEISFSKYKQVSTKTLVDDVHKSLIKMGIIRQEDEVVAKDLRTIPLAYPVYTKDWDSSRTKIIDFYETKNVYCAGRFGEWLYINTDDAIMRGKVAFEKILNS